MEKSGPDSTSAAEPERRMARLLRMLLAGVALVVVQSCASPGRNDYAVSAAQHQRWAQEAREGASEDAAASQSMVAQGHQARAQEYDKNAKAFMRRAQLEQWQADKDRWLSQWWPY